MSVSTDAFNGCILRSIGVSIATAKNVMAAVYFAVKMPVATGLVKTK